MHADAMFANPRKTTSVRQLGMVDISGIRDAILAIPESVWEKENADKPNRFKAFDVTSHIVFRFVDDTRDWRGSHDRPLWADWRARLLPVMEQATRPYRYVHAAYPRVMLARVPPGGEIKPHFDVNPAAKWPHKIHVPILTNDKVTFFIDGVGYHFAEGQAVEVSNMAVHAVENAGDRDRIHLIFEYYDLDQPAPGWIDGIQGV
jgi:hypothetical protein